RSKRDWSSDVCSSDLSAPSSPCCYSQLLANLNIGIIIGSLKESRKWGRPGQGSGEGLERGRLLCSVANCTTSARCTAYLNLTLRSEERRVGKGSRKRC